MEEPGEKDRCPGFICEIGDGLDLHYILTNDLMYNLASGTLAKISFSVFFLGTVVRTVKFMSLTRKVQPDTTFPAGHIRNKVTAADTRNVMHRALASMRHTVLAKNPLTISISLIFHVCLFATPLFLLAHNIMIARFMGVSLFSFSVQTTTIMTILFLLCAFYFLARRIFSARVRIITSFGDYVVLTITTLPFLTGLLAYYQIYDYRVMIVLHMLSGELMLAAAPFTKIFHMVFFFVARFMIIGQHTIGKGNRAWQW